MENTMNVKGKYKYYVKYDGLRHNLWMVIKYKVDDTKKVYKTNFNITEFINDFQSIFFEDPKDTFRRTSRIYADYILNCGDWKWDNSVSLAGMGGNWNITNENWDNMSLDDYLNFSIAWLSQAKRILKPTGSM